MWHVKLFVTLLLLVSTSTMAEDKHLVCKEVDDIFAPQQSHVLRLNITYGRPGKRGQPGQKGEPGNVGPSGPAAVVDYQRINANVMEQVSADIGALISKVDNLTSKIEIINGQLEVVKRVSCGIIFDEKCYRAVLHDTDDVTFESAESLCENIGGRLANIYNATHYEKIVNYVRLLIPSTQSETSAWLGMTFNQQTRETHYSDGSRATLAGIEWFPEHPMWLADRTKVCVVVPKDPAEKFQGIHTFPPQLTQHGSICELRDI